ncbi:MAG: hypothetical protein HQK53_19815 [Oligoflexia bacterium]|nr:hypothetical protein [Oligoflexia bacterium]
MDVDNKVSLENKKFVTDVLGARPSMKMEYTDKKLKVDIWQGVDFYVNLPNMDSEPIKCGRPCDLAYSNFKRPLI